MTEPPSSVVLPPEPRSACRARRLVQERLVAAGRPEWVEHASLAVTELVTNAVLHAHSDIEVRVAVEAGCARITVRDWNQALPTLRARAEFSTTGRGLALVAALSTDHGIRKLADGKEVWCCVSATPSDEPEDGGGWADLDDVALLSGGDAVADEVVLRRLPPTLWLAAREHHATLLRELALVTSVPSGQSEGGGPLDELALVEEAARLLDDAVDAAVAVTAAGSAELLALPAGLPRGLPVLPAVVDVRVGIGPELLGRLAAMQDVLDFGERLATSGQLLARPGLPEIVTVRDWACEQVVAQASGSPPAPWSGVADERFATARTPGSSTDWADHVVTRATTGLIAVDEGNRIIAVSQPLVMTLGWPSASDLVGRRVVAIIPPQFREAHVAGFSRHLSTGVAHALDVPLRLPVMRADGSEVLCECLIRSERSPGGTTVFVARIEPLGADR